MAQWRPPRSVLCILVAGLLIFAPDNAASQPAFRYQQDQQQPAVLTRPPSLMLSVYRWTTANPDATCELPGGLLAAVGEVTSEHGLRGAETIQLDDDGTLRPGLFGPPIGDDTDGGQWDSDQVVDRPAGPFQFTPATWASFGMDGNGDGVADPQNAWDAAAAASAFLCAEGAGKPDHLDAALTTYFGSNENAVEVLEKMPTYGALTGRNTVGEPSQLGTYWTDETGAYLDRWTNTTDALDHAPLTIASGDREAAWIVGDWNGDGATTPAAYLPGADGLGTFTFFGPDGMVAGDPVLAGRGSAIPLAGDWNADGIDDVGTFVTAGNDGIFFLGVEKSAVEGPDADSAPTADQDDGPLIARFGQAGDIPIIGDWDGDGYDGPGVYRPSTNTFHFADQRGRPMGAPVDASALTTASQADTAERNDEAGAAFLEVISATASGRVLNDIGILDLINGTETHASSGGRTAADLAAIGPATPLVADWDGDGFSDLGLVRHDGDVTVVERFDTHHHSMGVVELPWSLQVASGRWEPRTILSAEANSTTDGQGTTDISPHDGEEVPLARVGGILVHADIADNLAAMIDAAAADGIALEGWGWRSHQRQIELRAQNCADVWETPANQCSPPTAIPGHSRHESGKAIDFHVEGTALRLWMPQFGWLQEYAADYGFFNLPSEPWHWSVDGK